MSGEIEIGDFIKGSYKFGCICGIAVDVKKSTVVIKECRPHYNEYTVTNRLVNVTKSRINQIGLDANEVIKQ